MDALESLVAAVCQSRKYRHVSRDLIRFLAARELSQGKKRKAALKGVKNKLHQIAGAYFTGQTAYPQWLAALTEASQCDDPAQFQAACRAVMQQHASTRERLSLLPHFYPTLFAELPLIRSILDVACGLNPLTIPWMPLTPDATYLACDIYHDLVDFLAGFLPLTGLTGRSFVCDLISGVPPERVDLALVLKVLPPLEQVERGAGLRLLQQLQADTLLVSFPAQSLGGRAKGMATTYETRFLALIAGEDWTAKRFTFETELVFLVRK